MTILVVDDSAAQRRVLRSFLTPLGYRVIEAESGEAALSACAGEAVDMVISDWVMPGMSGLEFCRAFRALPDRPYGYFMLLTTKSDKPEIALGLDAGADDFVSKPVNSGELVARIRAGERILKMARELRDKNRIVSETLSRMNTLYEELNRDLAEARKLQQSLVRETHRDFARARVSLLLRPAGQVGGDLVGFIPVDDDHVGLFAIDVSGHGVAAALLTARLAGHLTSQDPTHNVALCRNTDGQVKMCAPAEVAARLNRLYLSEIQADHYFTLMLGRADLATGQVDLVQCGHPRAVVQDALGHTELRGAGGFPVGLLPAASWEEFSIGLAPGGRLLLASDGMTELAGPLGEPLDEEGLATHLRKRGALGGVALLEALADDLDGLGAGRPRADDMSAVLFEYLGPESRQKSAIARI